MLLLHTTLLTGLWLAKLAAGKHLKLPPQGQAPVSIEVGGPSGENLAAPPPAAWPRQWGAAGAAFAQDGARGGSPAARRRLGSWREISPEGRAFWRSPPPPRSPSRSTQLLDLGVRPAAPHFRLRGPAAGPAPGSRPRLSYSEWRPESQDTKDLDAGLAIIEESLDEGMDPRDTLSKLLAEPLLAQDLQDPLQQRPTGQASGYDHAADGAKSFGAIVGEFHGDGGIKKDPVDKQGAGANRENATLRSGAYKGNDGFSDALDSSPRKTRQNPIAKGVHDAFSVSFPFSRGGSRKAKSLELAVHLAVGLVLIVAFLGAWLGCCTAVPVLAPGFWLLFVVGLAFCGLSFVGDDGWMLLSALSLTALAAISAVLVGNDPLMMRAFCSEVGKLRHAHKELQRHNATLEARLDELSRVQEELLRISEDFEGDLLATQAFLKEMEKMVVLQIVTDILNLYFTAPRGDVFASSLVIMPDLVPGFDMDELVESVRLQGLTIPELATLLDAVVADDPAACSRALKALCRRGGGAKDAEKSHVSRMDYAVAPGPPGRGGAVEEDTSEVVVVPLVSIGSVRIYNLLHLAVIIATFLSLIVLTVSLVRLDVPNIACAILELALAGGLAVHAELLVTVQALRAEIVALRRENARFERANLKLAEEAAFLGRLSRGFDRLQAEFAGSIERAREAILRRNASVKTSTIAVVAHLFARADADQNGVLDEEEAEAFVKSLELVFHGLPDFDTERIRRRVASEGLRSEHLAPLMDLILGAEQATSFKRPFLDFHTTGL
uniref:EF-hand domain-containing protein n=1 Tax=Alexandrium catenella TaxID=2925 RepID=A0A7S1RSC0_ALECA|mmetsp:Transcript_71044/g.188889  ORF Transcript_71044/g.188889 Transcript_71044/m.188889 type:complete len:779 (+) Transcript_71044:30-2366(+)